MNYTILLRYLIFTGLSLIFLSCSSAVIRDTDISSGNYSSVQNSITQGAKPQAKDLYAAVSKGDLKMTNLLIENGADINAAYKDHTILGWAALLRQKDIVNMLLEKGAILNTGDKQKITPFSSACLGGDPEIVRLMLEKGVDINSNKISAVLYTTAVVNESKKIKNDKDVLSIVQLLHDKGYSINTTNGHLTPLLAALGNQYYKTARYLISKGAMVNDSNNFGKTPLHTAAYYGSFDMVKLLISKGAKVDAKNKEGETPIVYSVYREKGITKSDSDAYKIISLLTSKGADVNISTGKYASSLLHLALYNNYTKSALFLAKKMNNTDSAEEDGTTPLMLAADIGDVALVKFLLDRGADVNKKDIHGRTPVFFALTSYKDLNKKESSILQIVKLLTAAGADLNIKVAGIEKTTTVNIEGFSGSMSQVLYQGYTPLHLAVDNNYIKAAGYLIKNGADKNARDALGLTPLMFAARNGDQYSDMAGMLIGKEADVNAQNNGGWTALMICCQYKSLKIADQILSREPDLKLKTDRGTTAYAIARMYKLNELADNIQKMENN